MDNSALPPFAEKGSKRWLQIAVNLQPSILDDQIRAAAHLPGGSSITWHTPLRSAGFRERFDQSLRECLGIRLNKPLREFWPKRGPQWDGVAQASTGDVFLIEAKAHIGEMNSNPCSASDAASRAIIEQAFRSVQNDYAPGAEPARWMQRYYQYANRLAHLHFLRQNGVAAHLVLIYFVNDADRPTSRSEYEMHIKRIEERLGVNGREIPFLHKVFVNVDELPRPA